MRTSGRHAGHGWEEAVHRNHYTIGHKQVAEIMMAYTFGESG